MILIGMMITIVVITFLTTIPAGRKVSLREVTCLRPPQDTATLDSRPQAIWCQRPCPFHLRQARSP